MKTGLRYLGPLLLALGGCASSGEKAQPEVGITVCPEPRPEVCTMDYRPVCANLKDATAATYSNGCTACGDANVVSWIEKACPE